MTPDAAGIEAALAAGLAAHGGWVCDRVGDGWRCWCGASLLDYWPAGGVAPRDTALSVAHRAHVAAALLPVVTQAQAEAWDKGYVSGHSNAMRRMSDEPNAPTTPNPYRARADESGAR